MAAAKLDYRSRGLAKGLNENRLMRGVLIGAVAKSEVHEEYPFLESYSSLYTGVLLLLAA
jgi:hypothetical protein